MEAGLAIGLGRRPTFSTSRYPYSTPSKPHPVLPFPQQIYPHGSTDKNPYVTMGSGSLAAMSVFETGYREDMGEAEAVELVKEAILAGVFNDLGSGSNVDITVIRKSGEVTVKRGYVTPNEVAPLRAMYPKPSALTVPKGATAVLSERFEPARKGELIIEDASPMVF